jgi:hypothetical protein
VQSCCFLFQIPVSFLFLWSSRSCLRLLPRLPVPSIFPSIMCFRMQFLRKMWLTQLALFQVIMCATHLSSLTSFFTRLVQLIFSIPLQTTFQNWWQQSSSHWMPLLSWQSNKNCQFIYTLSRTEGGERDCNFFVMRYACSVACNWVGHASIFHSLRNLTSGNGLDVYFQKGPLYINFFTTGVFIFAEKITKSPDASPNAGVLFNSSFS